MKKRLGTFFLFFVLYTTYAHTSAFDCTKAKGFVGEEICEGDKPNQSNPYSISAKNIYGRWYGKAGGQAYEILSNIPISYEDQKLLKKAFEDRSLVFVLKPVTKDDFEGFQIYANGKRVQATASLMSEGTLSIRNRDRSDSSVLNQHEKSSIFTENNDRDISSQSYISMTNVLIDKYVDGLASYFFPPKNQESLDSRIESRKKVIDGLSALVIVVAIFFIII